MVFLITTKIAFFRSEGNGDRKEEAVWRIGDEYRAESGD